MCCVVLPFSLSCFVVRSFSLQALMGQPCRSCCEVGGGSWGGRWLQSLPILWFHLPKLAIVSHTSKYPRFQNVLGTGLLVTQAASSGCNTDPDTQPQVAQVRRSPCGGTRCRSSRRSGCTRGSRPELAFAFWVCAVLCPSPACCGVVGPGKQGCFSSQDMDIIRISLLASGA